MQKLLNKEIKFQVNELHVFKIKISGCVCICIHFSVCFSVHVNEIYEKKIPCINKCWCCCTHSDANVINVWIMVKEIAWPFSILCAYSKFQFNNINTYTYKHMQTNSLYHSTMKFIETREKCVYNALFWQNPVHLSDFLKNLESL